jgi:hypothetical protein
MARKNRNTRKNRENNVPVDAMMVGGKRRKGGRKSRKLSSGARVWRDHMMRTYREMKARNPNTRLGDAMKAAKKTFRK